MIAGGVTSTVTVTRLCVLLLAACAAPPPDLSVYLGKHYSFCRSNVEEENRAALERARDKLLHAELDEQADVIIVPGFTSTAEQPEGIHFIGKERLLRAVLAWRRGVAPFLLLTGAYDEALHMKRWLMEGGIPESAILLEPCARHSHTNLRNAGRLMLSAGLPRGLVVTSFDQAIYFGRPRLSTFWWRCMKHLGYMVGELWHVDGQTVGFVPSVEVFRRGNDRADP